MTKTLGRSTALLTTESYTVQSGEDRIRRPSRRMHLMMTTGDEPTIDFPVVADRP